MDLFKLQIKKTRFSSRCPVDCFRLQMRIRESEFSSKCLGDIFRLLIESYGSNLTFWKGPLDLFLCFEAEKSFVISNLSSYLKSTHSKIKKAAYHTLPINRNIFENQILKHEVLYFKNYLLGANRLNPTWYIIVNMTAKIITARTSWTPFGRLFNLSIRSFMGTLQFY